MAKKKGSPANFTLTTQDSGYRVGLPVTAGAGWITDWHWQHLESRLLCSPGPLSVRTSGRAERVRSRRPISRNLCGQSVGGTVQMDQGSGRPTTVAALRNCAFAGSPASEPAHFISGIGNRIIGVAYLSRTQVCSVRNVSSIT
jgi:hypothetical protein